MEGKSSKILHRDRSSAPHRALVSSFAKLRQFLSFGLVDTLLGTKKGPQQVVIITIIITEKEV